MAVKIRHLALAAVTAALAAGCGSPAASSLAAPKAPPHASKATVTAKASPAKPVTPTAACKYLAGWESSGAAMNAAYDAKMQREFAAVTDLQLSGDFATWVSDVHGQSPDTDRAADQITADCQSYKVGVFGASASPPASPSPSGSSSASSAAGTVTYIVTGSPADVTYGPAGSEFSGSVPMSATKPLGSPAYYAISAQLQGSGTVDCGIKIGGVVVSKATASGGYGIASCEAVQDFNGNWVDANG